MDAALRKHAQQRKAAMLAERAMYEPDWQQVADYVDPYAGRFLKKRNAQGARKLPSRSKILNNSATRAVRTMDAGFMGGHTSKSRPWFAVTAPTALNELPDVRAWCDDVSQILRDTLAKSNFYTALPHFYHSRHLFGVAMIMGDEDRQDVVRWYARNIGTYAIALDPRGIADSVWYEYEESARNIVREWGERNPNGIPAQVKEAVANGRGDTKFLVQCLIEPNPDKVEGSRVMDKRPVRHVYWIDGASATDGHGCLCIEGSYEMRALAGRWDATGGDVYGSSPGIESLGDIKQLQYAEGEKVRLKDLLTKPPMALPDSMRNRQASMEPGSKTYFTPQQVQQTIGPIYTPDARGLAECRADIAELKERIEAAFFADLFRMLDFLDDRQRTAYEISERKEEKVAMLGPALESLTDEVLTPAIEITFASLERAGRIPPPPEALQNVALKIEFTSTLAMAQKAAGLGSIERTVGFAAQLFQASGGQLPVWDKIDADQAIDEFNDRAGGPARIVRSDDDVSEIRAGRAQAQQQEKLAQMAPALKQGAEALKVAGETVPAEGSVLEKMGGQFALPS